MPTKRECMNTTIQTNIFNVIQVNIVFVLISRKFVCDRCKAISRNGLNFAMNVGIDFRNFYKNTKHLFTIIYLFPFNLCSNEFINGKFIMMFLISYYYNIKKTIFFNRCHPRSGRKTRSAGLALRY